MLTECLEFVENMKMVKRDSVDPQVIQNILND